MLASQPDPRKTLIVLQGCLILLVLFFQLLKYRGPTVNRSVFYFTFANFGLQMSAFLVLPLDVLSIGTQTVDGQGEEAVKIYWEVFYWTNLLAGWIFQPLYLYYYQSAEFTRKKKWKEAVKVWLIWTIIPVCLGVLGWLYLYSTTDKVRFDYKWNRDFVIALSNAYGSFILVIALSFGLIKVPKRQWEQRNLKIILGYRYYLVKIYEDNRREAVLALTDLYGVLVLLKEKVANTSMVIDERTGALDTIYKQIPKEVLPALKEAHESGVSRTQDYSHFLTKPMVTMPLIVEFNSLFQSALNDLIMADHLRKENLVDVYYYRRIQECIDNGDQFIPDRFTTFKSKELIFKLANGFEYSYYKTFHFKWSMVKLTILIALSALVFLGQIQIYFNTPIVSKAMTGFFELRDTAKYASVLVLVSGFFGYMVYISCHSLFSIKIQGYYGFYPGRTDPTTLLTFVFYLSKLTYPLCYTTLFILLGDGNQIRQTSFYRSIGDLSVVPILGYDIQRYLPVLFMFLLILFYFDYFSLMLGHLGFRFYNFSNNSGQAPQEELQGKRMAAEQENMFYEELAHQGDSLHTDNLALLGEQLYLL